MSEIDSVVKDRDDSKKKSVEDVFRRVEPFIKRPVRKPIERKPWKAATPDNVINPRKK